MGGQRRTCILANAATRVLRLPVALLKCVQVNHDTIRIVYRINLVRFSEGPTGAFCIIACGVLIALSFRNSLMRSLARVGGDIYAAACFSAAL